ncbi:MAG: hypothetical protein J2P28_03070 [Actinobacteria bacterium]|nr:hypothetical protein [Actinomycetota bacterium]
MKLTGNGKAAAYQQLLDNFGMTYVELATRLGACWAAQPAGEGGSCWASVTGTITEANLDNLGAPRARPGAAMPSARWSQWQSRPRLAREWQLSENG